MIDHLISSSSRLLCLQNESFVFTISHKYVPDLYNENHEGGCALQPDHLTSAWPHQHSACMGLTWVKVQQCMVKGGRRLWKLGTKYQSHMY